MLAVAGLALPAALMLSDEMINGEGDKEYIDKNGDGVSDINDGPTASMVGYSRFNAVIMILGYLLYLLFQLGSHKDEFEDMEEEEEEEENSANANGTNNTNDDEEGQPLQRNNAPKPKTKMKVRKNKFCHNLFRRNRGGNNNNISEHGIYQQLSRLSMRTMEMSPRLRDNSSNQTDSLQTDSVRGNNINQTNSGSQSLPDYIRGKPSFGEQNKIPQSYSAELGANGRDSSDTDITVHSSNVSSRRRVGVKKENDSPQSSEHGGDQTAGKLGLLLQQPPKTPNGHRNTSNKSHCSDGSEEEPPYIMSADVTVGGEEEEEIHMSFRAGLLWLFVITLSISAMSDILVDTIDGFAYRYRVSEVFTSLVILPYFSNIAEQVSALIFAYRNEMDLCIGITVGSAVQIALFVLPGSVLIGWAMDRSMSLFFRGFETCCLIFSVVSVAAVLQGGTTNWLVGAYLLGVYFMVAAGFWFHELENLSIDGELLNLHNHTEN